MLIWNQLDLFGDINDNRCGNEDQSSEANNIEPVDDIIKREAQTIGEESECTV